MPTACQLADSSKTFAQDWALDAVGNWQTFKQDFNGSGYTFDQTRDSNKDNEIETLSGSGGADWVDPVYNRHQHRHILHLAAPTPLQADAVEIDVRMFSFNRTVPARARR